MPYQPTGKPPGRPRKEPKVEPATEVVSAEPLPSPFHVLPMSQFVSAACPECWPGVTKFHALQCKHGTFIHKP